jgi:hypothetical protein
MLSPKTTSPYSRLVYTRRQLACAGKCVFSIGIIASFCIYGFVTIGARSQLSTAAASPTIDGHMAAIEQEKQLYEADIRALKHELHLTVGQRGEWARAEAALRSALSEFIYIPPGMFEADKTLLQRIDLVSAANLNSRKTQELCAAMRSLFENVNEDQRSILERWILVPNVISAGRSNQNQDEFR